MSLEAQDIVIIVAAVVVTLLLMLCLINLCYFLWIRRDKRFTAGFGNDEVKPGHHHYEHRSGGYQYNLTPDNQFEHSVQYTNEGPTRYARVAT